MSERAFERAIGGQPHGGHEAAAQREQAFDARTRIEFYGRIEYL